MRKLNMLVLVPLAIAAAACGRTDDSRVDDALRNDLALASQTQPYTPQQFVGPNELGYAGQAQYNPYAAQPVRASAPVRRTSTARRSSGTYSTGTVRTTTTVRHTNRDAAIGAAAGAVIGATTSRDKVKGGLIGAAAGGILGAVIGHNVDIQHRPNY